MNTAQTTENDTGTIGAGVEAALLCSERALSVERLAAAMNLDAEGAGEAIAEAVEALNQVYEESGRSFRVERVAGGYRLMTLPEHASVIAAVRGSQGDGKLSRAAIETLSIVAYRQPVTRAEIESIRGVSSGEMLRSLLEKRLVDIAGRAEEPGRPLLYGTTRSFLESFGLATLKDLPRPEEIAGGDA